MTNFDRTAAWLKACGKEPSPQNLSLQIGRYWTEVGEFHAGAHCGAVPVSCAESRDLARFAAKSPKEPPRVCSSFVQGLALQASIG